MKIAIRCHIFDGFYLAYFPFACVKLSKRNNIRFSYSCKKLTFEAHAYYFQSQCDIISKT